MDLEDAVHSYALEMIVSHIICGGMYSTAADLLADKSFVRGRLLSLGRENSTSAISSPEGETLRRVKEPTE